MIGRLVEQQDIGSTHQCAGEIQPHAPTTGKLFNGFRIFICRKAETVQQSRRARLGGKAVDSLHTFVKEVQVGLVRGGFAFGNGGLHCSQLVVAIHYVVDSGATAVRAFLCDVGDFLLRVEGEFTIVRLQLAQEHRK